MRCYNIAEGKLESAASLWAALKLSPEQETVVSFVGAGGKTSLMYELAREAADLGKRVIVTTTTHIFYPSDHQVLEAKLASQVEEAAWKSNILVVGQRAGEEKLKGLPEEETEKLKAYADVLLIEADGAKRLPLKVPGNHEPVIIPQTCAVIACAGLDSLGEPLKDICFRYELACERFDLEPDQAVKACHLAEILLSQGGGKKSTEGMKFRAVLNKADTVDEQDIKEMVQQMERSGVDYAIVSFRE